MERKHETPIFTNCLNIWVIKLTELKNVKKKFEPISQILEFYRAYFSICEELETELTVIKTKLFT